MNLPEVSLGDLGSSFTIQGPKGLPQLAVSGYFNAGGALAGPVSTTDFYAFRDVVSLTKGRHTLNIEAKFRSKKMRLSAICITSESSTSKRPLQRPQGIHWQISLPAKWPPWNQDTPYHGLLNTWYYAGFIQDNYRVTPRLTASLGLRYDVGAVSRRIFEPHRRIRPRCQIHRCPQRAARGSLSWGRRHRARHRPHAQVTRLPARGNSPGPIRRWEDSSPCRCRYLLWQRLR